MHDCVVCVLCDGCVMFVCDVIDVQCLCCDICVWCDGCDVVWCVVLCYVWCNVCEVMCDVCIVIFVCDMMGVMCDVYVVMFVCDVMWWVWCDGCDVWLWCDVLWCVVRDVTGVMWCAWCDRCDVVRCFCDVITKLYYFILFYFLHVFLSCIGHLCDHVTKSHVFHPISNRKRDSEVTWSNTHLYLLFFRFLTT